MSDGVVNEGRRRFLTAATSVVGVAGVVGAAVPFVASWNPSAKAKAAGAPVKVNIGKLEMDAMITAEWRGKPVYIMKRSESTLASLEGLNETVADPHSANADSKQPEYAQNLHRSAKPEILVLVGLCTHLGCAPQFKAPRVESAELGTDGGFFCPCHGSKFDLAGRVYKSVPAPSNLEVPPYSYEGDNVLVIGVDPEASA